MALTAAKGRHEPLPAITIRQAEEIARAGLVECHVSDCDRCAEDQRLIDLIEDM